MKKNKVMIAAIALVLAVAAGFFALFQSISDARESDEAMTSPTFEAPAEPEASETPAPTEATTPSPTLSDARRSRRPRREPTPSPRRAGRHPKPLR